MAKKTNSGLSVSKYRKRAKVSRPGVHSKKRSSNSKISKNYLKKSVGQG